MSAAVVPPSEPHGGGAGERVVNCGDRDGARRACCGLRLAAVAAVVVRGRAGRAGAVVPVVVGGRAGRPGGGAVVPVVVGGRARRAGAVVPVVVGGRARRAGAVVPV